MFRIAPSFGSLVSLLVLGLVQMASVQSAQAQLPFVDAAARRLGLENLKAFFFPLRGATPLPDVASDERDTQLWAMSQTGTRFRDGRESASFELLGAGDEPIAAYVFKTAAELPEVVDPEQTLEALSTVLERVFSAGKQDDVTRAKDRHTHPFYFADRGFTRGDKGHVMRTKALLDSLGLQVAYEAQVIFPTSLFSLKGFKKRAFVIPADFRYGVDYTLSRREQRLLKRELAHVRGRVGL